MVQSDFSAATCGAWLIQVCEQDALKSSFKHNITNELVLIRNLEVCQKITGMR